MSGQGNGKQSTYIYVGRVNVVRAGDSIHLAQNHSGMVIWESKQPMVLGQGATGAPGCLLSKCQLLEGHNQVFP